MSLPESLERAACQLSELADQIRPANGDPHRLLDELSPEDAGQLLVWILTEEPEAATELIEGWSQSDPGAKIVLGISDAGIPKLPRKALRRARHRLHSQGIVADENSSPVADVESSAPTPTRRFNQANDRFEAAHVSTPDFRGARVGYLVESHPSGGARLFEIRFDEGRGILDFKIYNAGRTKVRGFLRSLTGGKQQRLFDVDRDALRALVRRASLAQPIDRPLPSAFVEWRRRLFAEDLEKQSTPGDLVRESLADDAQSIDSSQALEETLKEVRAGSLGPWPPRTAWVGEWMEKGRADTDDLDAGPRANAIEVWLGLATEALTKETDLELLSRHLDELAWIRWRSDALPGALALLAVSDVLGKSDEAAAQMSRARVDGLFQSFLAELRVVEEDGLAPSDSPDASGSVSATE
ncbi:MAG TPA: hypothetical protein EYQ60_12265 [Myxococcales bacterium]|nr:hypothetical protein [Myxococcales bacterium]HIK86102.1 hypothetical protein [Myxococcales bacterium]